MNLFHFDIETCGRYPNFGEFSLSDKRGSELFINKFNKMNWKDKYSSIDEAYLENSPIISTYGKICCISFGISENGLIKIGSYYSDDEFDIVNKFNESLKKLEKKDYKLSGFRISYFDIPWILHKLHKYGLEPANIISPYNKKPWDMRIVDMSDDWKNRFAWSFSFDEMTYELGIDSPKRNLSGDLVHKYYWDGKLEDIKNYCESDVRASIESSYKIYNIKD